MRDLKLERTAPDERPSLPPARGPFSAEILGLLAGGRATTQRAPSPLDPRRRRPAPGALPRVRAPLPRPPGRPDAAEWEPAILRARRTLSPRSKTDFAADRSPEVIPQRWATPSDGLRSARRRLAAGPPRAGGDPRAGTGIADPSFRVPAEGGRSALVGDPSAHRVAKTAVIEIQYDEYGSGDPAWMHASCSATR